MTRKQREALEDAEDIRDAKAALAEPGKRITLKELNALLKLDRKEVLRRVRANCRKLTGKDVI